MIWKDVKSYETCMEATPFVLFVARNAAQLCTHVLRLVIVIGTAAMRALTMDSIAMKKFICSRRGAMMVIQKRSNCYIRM